MAVATSAAVATGLTAAKLASAAKIASAVGAGVKAVGAGVSFAQANKQNKLRKEAEEAAAESMAEARKTLGVNYIEGLSLPMEVYELEREALLSSGQQALQAAQEGETRGSAATAGRVQMAQQQGQRRISAAQADRLFQLQQLAAQEDARLAGLQAGLSLSEMRGAQQAARDFQESRNQAVGRGFEGLVGAGETIADYTNEIIPLYKRQKPADLMMGVTVPQVNQTVQQTEPNLQQFNPFRGGV